MIWYEGTTCFPQNKLTVNLMLLLAFHVIHLDGKHGYNKLNRKTSTVINKFESSVDHNVKQYQISVDFRNFHLLFRINQIFNNVYLKKMCHDR